jgi:maltooligosyltrehalose trehalohydrolase
VGGFTAGRSTSRISPPALCSHTRAPTIRSATERTDQTHARVLACYRDLLALRKKRIEITDPWLGLLHVDYDEDDQWITLRRGALQIVCNLGTDAASVPAGGTPILWWDPPTQDETASATVVPGHSFVVLES